MTLDKEAYGAAAAVLHEAWNNGTKLAGTPRPRCARAPVQRATPCRPPSPPGSAGSAYGWKIAGTNEAGRRHINVAAPLAARGDV